MKKADRMGIGAKGGTRTRTIFLPQGPKPCASANSATLANQTAFYATQPGSFKHYTNKAATTRLRLFEQQALQRPAQAGPAGFALGIKRIDEHRHDAQSFGAPDVGKQLITKHNGLLR